MFRRVLIANRGEIAARIVRTCRRLGVETVAVYSDADRRAPHVLAADLARRIGPAEPARSYLDGAAILEAARASGAEAIHPGYGFLAENAMFAEQCAQAGLVFVGPGADAIRAVGSKESSRRLATELGVPIVAGYHGPAQDEATLRREAKRIGFPLLVKASAGGGGRGIRIVANANDLGAAVAAARREAQGAFGDSSLVLERYLERARHVEVQVVGDRFGRTATLFDRDCSVQRNHQKLVEEAPAPALPGPIHDGLRISALRVAEAIGYDSVGTVEFLVDEAAGELFFLEMNTRLQVEHPTTELVTGLDLVELQLRIASGEALPDELFALQVRGAAIEARVCAERPHHGFAPATGTVLSFAVPPIDGVRVDSGVAAGTVIGTCYDSMLAKVIAHGRDREEARRRLAAALRGTVLTGVETNLDFLRTVLETPAFRLARLSTRFLELELPAEDPEPRRSDDDDTDLLAAAAAQVLRLERERRDEGLVPWDRLAAWRVTRRSGETAWTSVRLRREDGETAVVRLAGSAGRYDAQVGEPTLALEAWWSGDGELRLDIAGALHRRFVMLDGSTLWLCGGERHRRFTVISRDEQAAERDAATGFDPRNLVAPFPGLVTSVEVNAGDRVETGGVLVIMEAMKMVHTLRAAGSGSVRAVHCQPGTTVAAGHVLVEFEGSPS
jgi:3-methylcrotonyl-CoA carboxylase alpha subunit